MKAFLLEAHLELSVFKKSILVLVNKLKKLFLLLLWYAHMEFCEIAPELRKRNATITIFVQLRKKDLQFQLLDRIGHSSTGCLDMILL